MWRYIVHTHHVEDSPDMEPFFQQTNYLKNDLAILPWVHVVTILCEKLSFFGFRVCT